TCTSPSPTMPGSPRPSSSPRVSHARVCRARRVGRVPVIRGYAVADVRAAEDGVRAGLPDGELMQRAARGLAEVVAVRAEQYGAGSVVVLAGPGDNGGDALWAASFLDGPTVTVVGIARQLHAEGLAAARAA